jgi:hypothetical protein
VPLLLLLFPSRALLLLLFVRRPLLLPLFCRRALLLLLLLRRPLLLPLLSGRRLLLPLLASRALLLLLVRHTLLLLLLLLLLRGPRPWRCITTRRHLPFLPLLTASSTTTVLADSRLPLLPLRLLLALPWPVLLRPVLLLLARGCLA